MFQTWFDKVYLLQYSVLMPLVNKQQGKGKGTRYLTSEVPLLSREYPPRKFSANDVELLLSNFI